MTRLTFQRPSRIGLRLLAFNVLVVFVPVLGVLYLDVYESRLRHAQEAGLVQQARVLAAALGDRPLDAEEIARTFARFDRRSDARFRVYDGGGALIADSARQSAGTLLDDRARYPADDGGVRSRRLYRFGAWLANLRYGVASRIWRADPQADIAPTAPRGEVPAEVRMALAGHYGASTRVTPGQRSVTLFSAIPVRDRGTVSGVVVASQSTMRILLALYAIRLRIFEIVLGSLVVAALLTALAAATIVRPLTRLRRRAAQLAERRGPLPAVYPGATRKDEIGDLARALGELSRRTNDHVTLLQTFSADVSHELKNPLAAIRTAAEMMSDAETAEQRVRFRDLMVRDVARLERLVSGLRDVARVEGQIEADVTEPVDLDALLSDLVAAAGAAAPPGIRLELASNAPGLRVVASQDRLAQVFQNLLDNATSFSAPDSTISVTLRESSRQAVVTVDDGGPGIPEAHMDRIFARFFTYRPEDARREHVGLGLAIAKQIIESYNGTIVARNLPNGGARFEVQLPALR
jgi:two-component system, OmpR family, sensor histidine kinase ChvG